MAGRKAPDELNGKARSSEGRIFVTVRMDPDLLTKLDAEADERGVSRTYLVDRMVRDWLEAHALAG